MSDTLREAENLLKTIVSSSARLSSLRGKAEPSADTTNPAMLSPTTLDTPADTPTPINPDHSDDAGEEISPETPAKPMVLGIDLDLDPPPAMTPPTPDSSASVDPISEDQPFSFLDLIPSDTELTDEPDTEPETEPLDTPPPVRPKPTMPLPLGLAAGAPTKPTSQAAPPPRPLPAVPAVPAVPAAPPSQEHKTFTLSAPRAVAPQILDPERERLEVEVYGEDDPEDSLPPQPLPDAPRLTEPTRSPEAIRGPTPVIPREHPDEAIFDALTQAKTSISRGDLSAASIHLSDVLDWEPAHIEARLARGRCNRDLGDSIAAMSDFEKAIVAAPFSPDAHVEMGNLFFGRKDYGRAIQHYTDAIERDPSHAMALCRRGMCHHYRQRPESALDDLQSARLMDPEIPNIDRYVQMVSKPPHR